jgi:hypothetical protein
MTPDQAINFLKALGSKPHYDGSGWVRADCPLAPFTHKNSKDSNPSFGVSVIPGTHSAYNCYTCSSGSMEQLLQTVELYTQNNPNWKHRYNVKAARQLLSEEEVEVLPLPEFSEFGGGSEQQFQEWPSYFIDSFMSWEFSKAANDYLTKRQVPSWQREKHGLRFDSKRNMIVCPYKNVYGCLAGARGRNVGMMGMPHFDYTWNHVNNASLVWFNEEALQHEEPVVIVEGQFDAFRVERVYPHVIGNLTGKPVASKMKKLQQSPGAIIMGDNDPTADVSIKKYLDYLDKYGVQCAVIQPPKEYDSDGKLIKQDPDSMGEDWIREQLKPLVTCL